VCCDPSCHTRSPGLSASRKSFGENGQAGGEGRFVLRCRLSESRVASDPRRQFAKEAGDRGPGASGEVSIAGLRGVLEL
jgi:hypothetical protein